MTVTRHSLAKAIAVLAALATTLVVGPAALADFSPPPDQDQYSTKTGQEELDPEGVATPLIPETLPAGGEPTRLVTPDLNGDGRDDFAAITRGDYGPEEAWWFPSGVAVLLSQPDGSYGTAHFYHIGFEFRSYSFLTEDPSPLSCCPTAKGGEQVSVGLAAADVNGDGSTDLITANKRSDSVSVLINTGTDGTSRGVFAQPVHYDVNAPNPGGVAAADFDGKDGVDLALDTHDGVTVLYNDGAGRYPDGGKSYQTDLDITHNVTVAEMDGRDGMDILVTAGGVAVLLNDGTGAFPTHTGPFEVGSRPAGMVTADLDDDGDQDVATANQKSDNISVLLNDGAATLSEEADSPYATTNRAPADPVATDLNNDGHIDLATRHFADAIEVFRHDGTLDDGNGSFNPEPNSPYDTAGDFPADLSAGNFDTDSTGPDLATSTMRSATITVLHNR